MAKLTPEQLAARQSLIKANQESLKQGLGAVADVRSVTIPTQTESVQPGTQGVGSDAKEGDYLKSLGTTNPGAASTVGAAIGSPTPPANPTQPTLGGGTLTPDAFANLKAAEINQKTSVANANIELNKKTGNTLDQYGLEDLYKNAITANKDANVTANLESAKQSFMNGVMPEDKYREFVSQYVDAKSMNKVPTPAPVVPDQFRKDQTDAFPTPSGDVAKGMEYIRGSEGGEIRPPLPVSPKKTIVKDTTLKDGSRYVIYNDGTTAKFQANADGQTYTEKTTPTGTDIFAAVGDTIGVNLSEIFGTPDGIAKANAAGLTKINANTIANLKSAEALRDATYAAQEARYQSEKGATLDINEQEKQNAIAANTLKADIAKHDWDQQIAIETDKFSRLDGYLKAKLSVGNSLDSGAGLELLSKGMTMGAMALNDSQFKAQSVQLAYLQNGQQIMTSYAKSALEITKTYNDTLDAIDIAMMDNTINTNADITKSRNSQIEGTLSILSDSNNRAIAARKEAEAKVEKAAEQARKDAQQAFDNSYKLAELDETIRYHDSQTAKDTVDNFLKYGGSEGALAIPASLWSKLGVSAASGQAFAGAMTDKESTDFLFKLAEKGVAGVSKDTIDAARNGDSTALRTISSAVQAAAVAGTDIGDYKILGQTVEPAPTGPKADASFGANCVLYLRSFVPNFPPSGTGMVGNFAEKNQSMINAGWIRSPYPVPGAVVVEDTKYQGSIAHVARVNAVSPDGKSVTVDEAHYAGNTVTNNRNIAASKVAKSYWVDPSQQDNGGFYYGMATEFDTAYANAKLSYPTVQLDKVVNTVVNRISAKNPNMRKAAAAFLSDYAQTQDVTRPGIEVSAGPFSSAFTDPLAAPDTSSRFPTGVDSDLSEPD